jgi:hypothetical protein
MIRSALTGGLPQALLPWPPLRRVVRQLRQAAPPERASSYRDYTAFSFTAQGLTVTVVSRHPLPPSPWFDLVTDLEPFFEGCARESQEWLRRLYRQQAA